MHFVLGAWNKVVQCVWGIGVAVRSCSRCLLSPIHSSTHPPSTNTSPKKGLQMIKECVAHERDWASTRQRKNTGKHEKTGQIITTTQNVIQKQKIIGKCISISFFFNFFCIFYRGTNRDREASRG